MQAVVAAQMHAHRWRLVHNSRMEINLLSPWAGLSHSPAAALFGWTAVNLQPRPYKMPTRLMCYKLPIFHLQ